MHPSLVDGKYSINVLMVQGSQSLVAGFLVRLLVLLLLFLIPESVVALTGGRQSLDLQSDRMVVFPDTDSMLVLVLRLS